MGFTIGTGGGVNTLTTPSGWTILEDSGVSERINEQGPSATMRFKCLWEERYTLAQGLLGQWTGKAPGSIVYTGPYQYPFSPNLICTNVSSIEMHGKPIFDILGMPWLVKQYAIVTAEFTRPPWSAAAEGGYFSISFRGSAQTLDIPETTFRFADGTPTLTPIGLVVPQAEIAVKRFRMPFIPDAYVAQVLGCVNNAPFTIGYNPYPAGTLLFAGINTDTEADVLGNITYTVEYIFIFNPVGWQNAIHPNRTTGFAPVTNGNGAPPYAAVDFSILP